MQRMKYLAIDLGDKRTGLAVGDDVLGLVTPLAPLVQSDRERLILALVEAVNEHDPQALVLGLPYNMDGSEGPRAKLVRDFARALAERINLPLHFRDERLTSFQADLQMAGSGLTHKQKKARRDSFAAAAILQDFLNNLPAENRDN